MSRSKYFTFVISFNLYNVHKIGAIIISTLLMRKMEA